MVNKTNEKKTFDELKTLEQRRTSLPFKYESILTLKTINQNLIKASYEVRGLQTIRADQIKYEMLAGKKYPFDKFINLNIGNPQSLGQDPLSFPREVIGCMLTGPDTYKTLIIDSNLTKEEEESNEIRKRDVIKRAKTYLSYLNNKNINDYTDFKGQGMIRRNIANFIKKRDGLGECNEHDIVMTNGAGTAIKSVLKQILFQSDDAVMCPIPQYPLYSATISLLGSQLVGYYLDEENDWSVNIEELNSIFKTNEEKGLSMKAFVVINPGNPTGNVLTESNLSDIIKFCYDNGMILLSDEVYQNNIYSKTKKFLSMRQVANKMPHPYNEITVISFNSTSKGYYGECGLRGGYMDCYNVPKEVENAVLKYMGIDTCANIIGQFSMDLLINPPTLEDCHIETVQRYEMERDQILSDLNEKSKLLYKRLNEMKYFSCKPIEGALYAFPTIDFPDFIIEKAKSKNMQPDLYYCLCLVENTGIVTVHGSGFEQRPGSYHIRITNLVCPNKEFAKTLDRLEEFNKTFFSESQ